MEQGDLKKHRKIGKKLILSVIVIAVFLCIGFLIWVWHGAKNPFDSNAVHNKTLTEAEILGELQKAADESAFRFKINSLVSVVPKSAQSESDQIGDWNIINSIQNSCDMEVTITGKDGAVFYESRRLHPGEQELTGTLKEHLEPGTYEAEALAKAIDPETGEVLGNVTTDVSLNVEMQE